MAIYGDKQSEGPYFLDNSVNSVVKRMIEPVQNASRNITMDNYYMSVPLANELFAHYRTTMVGTLKRNKPQLPEEFKNVTGKPVGSTLFGFGTEPNKTMLVFIRTKKEQKCTNVVYPP